MTSRSTCSIDKKILCVLSKVNGCPTLSQTLEALGIVHEIVEALVLDVLSPSAAVAYGRMYVSRALKELAEISSLSHSRCEGLTPLVDKLFYTFDRIPQRSSERLRAALPSNEKTDLPPAFFCRRAAEPRKEGVQRCGRVAREGATVKEKKEKKNKAARPLPEVPRPRSSVASRKAAMVAQEIVDSERRYVKGLGDLLRVYKDPMARSATVRTQDVDTVFSAAPEIYALHTRLLGVLEERKEGDTAGVAGAFAEYIPQLRSHYIRYGKGFSRALCVLSDLKRTVPGFEEFVRTQSRAHFGAAAYDTLGALLITPVQRLPRYKLLLAELAKCSAPESPELLEAMRAVSEAVEAMNDGVGKTAGKSAEGERTAGSAEVVVENVLSVAAPGRKLVRRGDFALKGWRGVAKQGVHALLFVDALLLTRKKKLGGQLVVVLSAPLRNCLRVEELPRLCEPQMLADKASHVGFSLTTARGSVVLDARTKEERDEWVCDLRRLIIDAHIGSSAHRSVCRLGAST